MILNNLDTSKDDSVNFKTTVYGKYLLLDLIATGGMAEVFKAKTFGVHGFARLLVIKRILPHLSMDQEFVEMFIDEAKTAVELNHANIVQVTDLGKIENNYFIAMEFIDGKDLRAILKKCHTSKTTLPLPISLYAAMEFLKGLDYAHRKIDPITGKRLNIIHRDVSPQNIMVSYDGEVKVVDFGIAKTAAKLNRTQAGVLKGKFGYMSPEQASGLELDARTDVFSAGIILFECLTQRRLFLGETDFDTLEKIKTCEIPSPTKYNSEITPELEAILRKALAKEREDRYATAQEMQAALAKFFFTKYPDVGQKDVSAFLKTLFAEEIQKEQEALRRALDSLPSDQIANVTSAAEQDHERSLDSFPGRSVVSSRSGRKKPIGSDEGANENRLRALLHPSKRMRLLGIALVALIGIWLGSQLAYRLFSSDPNGNRTGDETSRDSTSMYEDIEIHSHPPGASVYLYLPDQKKDVRLGTTPLPQRLEIRKYGISFEMEGYKRVPDQLDVQKGKKIYTYTLEKDLPQYGTLRILTEPQGALIILDGEEKGITPKDISKVTTGNVPHYLTLKKEGYEPIVEMEIFLTEAQATKSYSLVPEKLTLDLNVSPTNSKIWIRKMKDGKALEEFSRTSNLIENLDYESTYQLKFEQPGYQTKVQTITMRKDVSLDIQLKKIVTPKGKIKIIARPWAQIYINGNLVNGEGSMGGVFEAPVGNATIEAKNKDFPTQKKEIKIVQGENPDLIIEMAPRR